MNILFDRIADILFLPLLYIMAIGLLVFALRIKKYRNIRIAMVALVTLSGMIGWRILFAGSATRYWAAILFPFFLLLVYFFYAAGWGNRIARVLFVGVIAAYLLKDFRLNWNNRAITNAAAVIAADSKQYKRVFASELRMTGLLERIGFYSKTPILSSRYCDGIQIPSILEPARGLYDVCYMIFEDTVKENLSIRQQLNDYGATLLFSQDKDMRKKKKIYVYKFELPPLSNQRLPILEEFCPNGDFENVIVRKEGGYYPRYWWMNAKLVQESAVLNGWSVFFKSNIASLLFSGNMPPIHRNGMLIFSVRASPGSHIRIYCNGYDNNKKDVFHKTIMNAIVPTEKKHQFQIPMRVEDFSRATLVNYRWYIISPDGMYLDDIGFYPKQATPELKL